MIHGKIESYPKRSSLIAPFQPELLEELQKYIPATFKVQLTYENVLVRITNKEGMSTKLFEGITNNRAAYENNGDLMQIYIMEFILKIYQVINPVVMVISLIFYLWIMIRFFGRKYRFKNYKQVILLNGLLCIYLVRILTVAYVAATEYESAIRKCQYLAVTYPVQSIFSILAIIFTVQIIMNQIKSKNQGGNRI